MVLADRLAENITAKPQAGVIKAWALVAKNRGDGGLAELLDVGRILVTAEGAMPAFIELQLALMSEYLGYQDEAISHANELSSKKGLPAKMILQIAGIFTRNGNITRAQSLLKQLPLSFEKLQLTENKFTRPKTITPYIADAIVDIALAYHNTSSKMMLPARLQLVIYLDPDNDPARFFLAQSWIELKQFERAKSNLAAIKDDSIWAQPRLLLQSDIETENGNIKTSIILIRTHLINHPNNGYLQKELGDLYRRNDQFEKASFNYLEALAAGYDTADVYRNLAISYEQLGKDVKAEANFKAALQRNPNDPFTLNYLGYWWTESGRNLSESIKLIERAVRLRPNSGFFVDSLGWVHYQLGNFDLAVQFLEKATMLEPADPLIVSHLGDAYWQTKRYSEARFKWNDAFGLTRDDALRDSIQKKMKSGIALLER
jgi:Flp pilus assembly protein TadD